MRLLAITFVALSLGACAMKNDSFVSTEPLRLQKETVKSEFSSTNVSRSHLSSIADDVSRRGEGPVTVTVQYMMKTPVKDAQRLAEVQGAQVKNYLTTQGVRQPVHVLIEPTAKTDVNSIIVSYDALRALAPKNCRNIVDADANNFAHESDSDYRYGCTQDHYLSAMIARPRDLAGNDATSPAWSQRQGKAMDLYRSGEPVTDPTQQNVSASTVYNSQ